MSVRRQDKPGWREFEKLVARIEADAGPLGIKVTSPDRVRCKVTSRLREVEFYLDALREIGFQDAALIRGPFDIVVATRS